MKLRFLTVLIGASIVIWTSVFVYHRSRKSTVVLDKVARVLPTVANRIGRDIDKLEAESAAQSRAKLSDVNMFYSPGPSPREMKYEQDWLPLNPEEDRADIDAILSNRRARKVFDELAGLNKAQASEVVNHELTEFLSTYSAVFEAEMNKYGEGLKSGEVQGSPSARRPILLLKPDGSTQTLSAAQALAMVSNASPAFAIGNVPESEIVIAGARLKMLSLLWFAGMLELEGTHPQVVSVANLALRQRSRLSSSVSTDSFVRAQLLIRASLFNRRILATALIGTSGTPRADSALLESAAATWEERKWASWRASLTEFDPPARSGMMKPDYASGSAMAKIISPLSDAKFDKIVEQVLSGDPAKEKN